MDRRHGQAVAANPRPENELLCCLAAPPHTNELVVAFSGGLDSTVLLHALSSAFDHSRLRACHVHHGLQASADEWADHCRRFADTLGVAFQTFRVTIDPADPAGPEAAARIARYDALGRAIGAGDVLVTAHHRDDQTETVLLRLLRGSGLRGLSAIPALTTFAEGRLWRPLLELPRAALLDYARQHRLDFIDDPHNADRRYTRSWLRHDVLPQLRQRFPRADAALAQAAALAAESVELVEALAAIDLADSVHAAGPADTLSVPALLGLSRARRHNSVRYWLRTRGFAIPSAAMIERITTELLAVGTDAEPCLHWMGCELRRYRDAVFAMPPLPPLPESGWSSGWTAGSSAVPLPPGCGEMIANGPPPSPLRVRLIRSGERWRTDPAHRSRSFKNLFQEAGVPPWIRSRMPLIEFNGQSALVPGLGLATAAGRSLLERGWRVDWHSFNNTCDPLTQ